MMINEKLFLKETTLGNHSLRIWVSKEDDFEISESIHKDGNGLHEGWKTLYLQVPIQGYFWSGMRKYAREITQKCEDCQNMQTYN